MDGLTARSLTARVSGRERVFLDDVRGRLGSAARSPRDAPLAPICVEPGRKPLVGLTFTPKRGFA